MTARIPTEIHELNGSFIHNPQRRPKSAPPKSLRALGQPPGYLSEDERALWGEIVENAPAGVLTSGDRHVVETLSLLLAKQRRREATSSDVAQLMKGLSSCGLTPADRSRVTSTSAAATDNPFSEFMQ